MKNVAFNTKKKWLGLLKGTSLGEQGSDSSYLYEDNENRVSLVATRLLTENNYIQQLDKGICNYRIYPITDGCAPLVSGCKWLDNVDRFFSAQVIVVYLDIEEMFQDNWNILMKEFREQLGKFRYVFSEYIPFY